MNHVRIKIPVQLVAIRLYLNVPGVDLVVLLVQFEKKIEPTWRLVVVAETIAGPILVGLRITNKPFLCIVQRFVFEFIMVGDLLHLQVQIVDVGHNQLVKIMVTEFPDLKSSSNCVFIQFVKFKNIQVLEQLILDLPCDSQVIISLRRWTNHEFSVALGS
ncbi:hypothetical protein OGAPHI_003491 [Ogataea philodendri]|uniref:Uncharacterized protein n=1 Tax=Ogataea philodendri TaxID=1378263 RepID=A0A9P8P775_9ASCO|nr:uncharacterized protein OGAPHI_003491 [Ogataea philodendri]KAH3666495.1 hypothetical protein OGAPHI_003491 [Ogataea philodendri]